MSFPKVSFEDSLEKNVVRTGRCVGCGTCVVVCPFICLELRADKPVLVKECKICGICAQTCPVNEWSWPKAENFVFGRERKPEEVFGIYRKVAIAKAKDDRVMRVCQDGGVSTAVLLFALENGIIDGAVLAGTSKEKPLYPVPRLATTAEEILEGAGTKYSYSPNVLALTDVLKQKKMNVAFVGTPCEIRAVRKLQTAGLKRFSAPLKLLVGLMCSEAFDYGGLMEKHVQKALCINLADITKMNIKGKMLVTTRGEVRTIPLADIKQYARNSCRFCDDFSSELADISVGGLGLEGWTFVIIRTEQGEKVFDAAEKAEALITRPVGKDDPALTLLTKLSGKKRKSTS